MENVNPIDRLYRQAAASPHGAQKALTAPLGVLAELLGHPGLFAHLQAALALQEQEPAQALTSVQLVRAAVRALIRQGYREKLTLKQLGLEMQRSMPEQTNPKMAAWLEPRWVGRTLRTEQLVDPDAKRPLA